MVRPLRTPLSLLPLVLLLGCPSDPDDGFGTRTENLAGVRGNICTPAGTRGAASVRVILQADEDEDGVPDDEAIVGSATTDLAGDYVIEGVTGGSYIATASRGHHSTVFPISFLGGGQFRADPACLDRDAASIALIDGGCDDISDRLDALGLEYDVISISSGAWSQLLTTGPTLAAYDILIATCGMPDTWLPQAPTVRNVLPPWLAAGGSLYVSGDAWPLIEAIEPDLIDFFRQDDQPSTVNVGFGVNAIATVADASLQPFFAEGNPRIRLSDDWAMIEALGADATALLTANVQSNDFVSLEAAPILVRSELATRGAVVYSPFGLQEDSGEDTAVIQDELLLSL